MSDKACRGPRALLMDYALDELDPLKRQRVDSHVKRCAQCRALLDRYGGAFRSVQDWTPEIAEDDLDRMVSRLTPYVEAQRPRRGGLWMGAGAFAMAAAAAAIFIVSRPSEVSSPAIVETIPAPAPIIVEKRQPTEHLRVVSSSDWNGKVVRTTPNVTRVRMTSGFAVMSFEGGKGRKLEIAAPDVTIEVIGTRFYVEAREDAPTVVGVVSGKIRVRSNGVESVVGAGEAHAFDREGMKPAVDVRSREHHTDGFLEYEPEEPAEVEAVEVPPKSEPTKPRVTKKRPAPKRKAAKAPNSMNAVLQAERLTREGRPAEAALLYTNAIDADPASALADVMRFERARLWAFKLGKRARAREALNAIASKDGEVAMQARLTLCELDRTKAPCDSKRCLEVLAADGVNEAEQTVSRWGLDRFDCSGQ